MLYVRPKISEHGLHLFERSIHPELLETCAVRHFERDSYVLTTSITTAGHCVTFRSGDQTLTEVCASLNQDLPTNQRLLSRPLDSRVCDEIPAGRGLVWNGKFRIESIDPAVILSIQGQLDEQGECEGLVHRFQPESGSPLRAVSYVTFQAFARTVTVRAFHTFPETLMIAHTETRFRFV